MKDTSRFELLSFPCDYPIKVFGRSGQGLLESITAIFKKHIPELTDNAFHSKNSAQGKYFSITVLIQATSKNQVDDLYQELTAHPGILMVL